LKISNPKRADLVAQMAEFLPSKLKALSSKPRTAKKKKLLDITFLSHKGYFQ
jgi:hypothetical protein